MAGFLSSFVLTGLLAAGPGAFSFDGPEVIARTTGNVGFFTQGPDPFTDLFERGTGSAELSVRDRITDSGATYGDAGSLVATFELAGDSYRVELEQVGFPPAQALSGMPVREPLPGAPAWPIAGGVVLDQEMHGGALLGSSNTSRVRAAAAVWGVGRVWRNGALLTDAALIQAAALERGAHADDGTFRTLPVARPGDTELSVLVWNLPREAEPRGFIQFDFDDVAITVEGSDVPAVAVVPTAVGLAGVEPPASPVPGGASLGAVPNSALPPQQEQGVGGSGVGEVQPTPIVPEAFLTPDIRPPFVPEAFQNNPARVSIGDELPPATGGGFVPLTPASQSTFLSTRGSFSVVPLVPGVAGPEFAFGEARVTSGVVATPSPAQVQAPAVPLLATPQPLNVQQPVPLVATPPPLNGQPAVPFISTPPPLNSQPVSATLPGASATAQGADSVPGLVTANPNAGGTPGATTSGVAAPGGATPSP